MAKIIRTYSIDDDLYEWFKDYSKKNSLNKSQFISNTIKELKDRVLTETLKKQK